MYNDDPNSPDYDPNQDPNKASTVPPPTSAPAPAPDASGAPKTPAPGSAYDYLGQDPTTGNKGVYKGSDGQYYQDGGGGTFIPYTGALPGAKKGGGDVPMTRPTGGNLSDPNYAAQYVTWAASQPGVNPSVKNDPNYWIQKFTSGAFGNDQDYALQRMMQAEGAPESGGGSAGGPIAAPNTQATGPDPKTQQQSDDLFNFLMGKAHQAQNVDPNDPMIRQQADSYSAGLTRTGRQYLSELAERKGPGGNLGSEARMVAEKNAQAGASHEGDLVQHESDQRRQEIMQALATGEQFMTAKQQQDLQRELANIDNSMKLYQTQVADRQFGQNLGQQNSQFNDNLRQRAYEYDTTDEYRRSPYATGN